MQVSGLTYTVDTAKAYDALEAYGDHWFTAGSVSRVSIDDVNGQPFDAKATYAVVTSNANFNGMDSSYVLKPPREEPTSRAPSPPPSCATWSVGSSPPS